MSEAELSSKRVHAVRMSLAGTGCILLAVKDFLQTFKEGKAHLCFTNINGEFDFRQIREEIRRPTIPSMLIHEYVYS